MITCETSNVVIKSLSRTLKQMQILDSHLEVMWSNEFRKSFQRQIPNNRFLTRRTGGYIKMTQPLTSRAKNASTSFTQPKILVIHSKALECCFKQCLGQLWKHRSINQIFDGVCQNFKIEIFNCLPCNSIRRPQS